MGQSSTWISATAITTILLFACASLPPAMATPGVGRATIRLGIHGPVTGAAPLPDDTASQAARVFWRFLRMKERKIHGRDVSVVFRNDGASPSQAVAVCKEMVEDRRVFALASLPSGLSDQIQACARYAGSVGVPYVSLGTIERPLSRLNRYFAVSATYRRQGRLLADMFVDSLGARGEVNGIVFSDSPSSEEPVAAFKRALTRRGVEIAKERPVSHTGGTTEARLVVEELILAGVENVFFLHRPTFFIQVLQNSNARDYMPQWTGIDSGIAHTDQVVQNGCSGGTSIDRARFLTPIPAYLDRDRFDPRHDRAMRRVYGSSGDTTTWFGWSFSKALKRMLGKPGRKPTRARFERTVERSRIRTGILPQVRFRPDDHFGGRGIHLLRADCSDQRWHTARRFVNDF